MAKTLQQTAEAQQPKSNAVNLNGLITAGFKKLLAIDKDIADLEAQHIAPLKEDRTEAWRQLKTDTDLNRKDLSLLYAIYKRDQEAADLEEESEREKVLNGLRAGYEALQQGQMLSFLAIVDGALGKPNGAGGTKDATAKAKEAMADKEARAAGREAGRGGAAAGKNPWAKGSGQHVAWEEGRAEGQTEILDKVGTGQPAA